jgi:transposase
MDTNVIYIGLDVDDTQYHGSALNKDTGEVITFQCRPTLAGLLQQLARLDRAFPDTSASLCYEASYIGYTLQRDLAEHGYHCDVVAPSSIPSPRGKQIKTDRIDAAQLAQFYANGLLTTVAIPEPEQEQDRDLLRSRQKLVEQRKELRTHVLSLLRRNGRHYRQETPNKYHWTLPHASWLEKVITTSSGSFTVNLSLLVRQLKATNSILLEYGQAIETMAKTERYKRSVQALTCYKGIKNLFALTMITEIGDIKRFPHPRQLMSWIPGRDSHC